MEAYLVEVGVLLTEKDKEFDLYNDAYDKRHGYYDEGQCYMKDKDKAIEYAKQYVADGVDRTYGIVSVTILPDDFDFEEGIVEDEEYTLENVIFSTAKVGGKIIEDFLVNEEELESLKELLINIINESENEGLSEKRRQELDELYLETDKKIKELESKNPNANEKNYMYQKLKDHIGHNIVCVAYGDIGDPADICIECEDCGCVLVSAEDFNLYKDVHFVATDIQWDVDSQSELENLPEEINLPAGMTNADEISNYISDKTGFCHDGFAIEQETPINYESFLYNAILAWYDDSLNSYHGLEDEEFLARVCEKTGLTEEQYRKLMNI